MPCADPAGKRPAAIGRCDVLERNWVANCEGAEGLKSVAKAAGFELATP